MTPGEWYGPHKVAVVLRDLLAVQMRTCDGFMASAVAADSTVFVDQIHELCADESRVFSSHPLLPAVARAAGVSRAVQETASFGDWEDAAVTASEIENPALDGSSTGTVPSSTLAAAAEREDAAEATTVPWQSSLYLQVPLRLGLGGRMDVQYWPAIRRLLALVPQCLGMVGGTPTHSLFFVGITPADKLVYLDPHTTQHTPRFHGGVIPSGKSLSAPVSARFRADDPHRSAGGREAAAASNCPTAKVAPSTAPAKGGARRASEAADTDALPAAPPLCEVARSQSEPAPATTTVAEIRAEHTSTGAGGGWAAWLDSWSEAAGCVAADSGAAAPPAGAAAVAAGAAPDAPPPPLRAAISARAWDLAQDDWASQSHSKSFHFRSAWLRTTAPTRIDPSLAIGFFCRDAADFADMRARIAMAFRGHEAPFAFEDTTPAWMLEEAPQTAAATAPQKAVPTYRDVFGLPPLRTTLSPAPAASASASSPAFARLAEGHQTPPAASTVATARQDSTGDLGSWVHVPPDVTLDDESGFLVVNHG